MNILIIGAGYSDLQLTRAIARLARIEHVLMVNTAPPPKLDPVEIMNTLAAQCCTRFKALPEPTVRVQHVYTAFTLPVRPMLPCPLVCGPESHRRKERDYG